MRYYHLLINGKELCSQSIKNPSGLNIQFNIQTYNAGETANSELTIYNPPLWMFGEYQSLYNQKVELFAGIQATPTTNMIGLVPSKQDLITSGYVAGVFPDWNGADMQMTLVLNQAPPYLTNEDGTIDISKTPGAYQFNLSAGVDPTNQIIEALSVIAPGVPFSSIVSDFITPSECHAPVYSVAGMAPILASWGLKLMMGGEGYILSSRDNAFQGNTIQLKKTDFLSQPSALDVSTIAITSFLRGDIRLGDTVVMPEDIFVGIARLGDTLGSSAGLEDWLKTSGKNIFSMFSGAFTVTKIWHVGDIRNTDINSWATHMECVVES
jgi:hypothetical protein